VWDDTPLCYQYTTAIRFLSYFVVFLAVRLLEVLFDLEKYLSLSPQAKQTFTSYFLAKAPEPERSSGTFLPHIGALRYSSCGLGPSYEEVGVVNNKETFNYGRY
jgi:hypothetical protein